jgi:ubiquinone/menaquinone biosynthesis C-methylase UbiE
MSSTVKKMESMAPESTKQASVFLSYVHTDRKPVEKLYDMLQEAGYDPWMDAKNILPGERWLDAIKRAIKKSDFFLACCSSTSVDREGTLQREIKLALDQTEERLNKSIWLIPVRLEDVELPDELADRQWVNLFDEDGWSRLRQAMTAAGFPGLGNAPVRTTERWNIVQETRIRDLIGPGYILDDSYHFMDWNPAFDELIAKPLALRRGQHALDFIKKLTNAASVIERSKEVFGPGKDPLVDIELLQLKSEKYGQIDFQKIAAQISDQYGTPKAWSISLNILGAEKLPELWRDLETRLDRELNWARYAVSYDQLLIPFDEYQTLLNRVVGHVGPATRCVDLGAGTGNGTIKLLETEKDREVWAIDSNENMLAYLRAKVDEQAYHGAINPERLTIIKEDILRLGELPTNHFDAAIMINVLYALDDPGACLHQVYRVLKAGGIVVLSTSHRGTDVDKLFERMKKNLEQKGKFQSLMRNFEAARQVHDKLGDRIHRDTKEDIRGYVESAGFEITTWDDSAYVEAVVLVVAIKRRPTTRRFG